MGGGEMVNHQGLVSMKTFRNFVEVGMYVYVYVCVCGVGGVGVSLGSLGASGHQSTYYQELQLQVKRSGFKQNSCRRELAMFTRLRV